MGEPTTATPTYPAGQPVASAAGARTYGPLAMAALGLLGAVIAWGVLAEFRPYWKNVQEGMGPPGEEQRAQHTRSVLLNNVSAFAIVGALMAACCAAGGAAARRTWVRPLFGALAGVIMGGALGALGGWAGHRILYGALSLIDQAKSMLRPDVADIVNAILQHALVWGAIGLGIGGAVALAVGKARAIIKSMVATALGGVVAAAAYVTVLVFFFPNLSPESLLPTLQVERLALFCVNGLLMGGFVGLALAPGRVIEAKE